ncbi:cyclic nucleotide-binding protein [Lachnospiraceae bacterium TWA4]|nr:cyclic nucleotide-binding protein [Lachnospiraceae bacterium TWA4]
MRKYLPVLQHSAFFSDIEGESLLAMLGCLSIHVVSYKQHEYAFHQGDSIKKIGLVLTGALQLEREDLDGNRTILDKLLPGASFGEAIVCSRQSVLPNSVVARSDCEVMYMDYDKILHTCSNSCSFHNHLIENMIAVLARRNVYLTNKLDFLSRRSTREKLLAYLRSEQITQQTNPITIHFTRQELADFLSVDRSAMSMELSKLQKDGIIKYKKNTFWLD